MCGIIYAKNLNDHQPVNALVKLMFLNQKERGTKGFGFVGLTAKRLDLYRATDEQGVLAYLDDCPYDEILLHHRLPTSTPNTLPSTHPFVITHANRQYYFIHNGIVLNADELRDSHCRMGIKYVSLGKDKTYNDSEALAWEFVLYLEKQVAEIRAVGSVAFICLQTDKFSHRAQKLFFCHNYSSPLKLYHDNRLLLLSSEGNWAGDILANQLFSFDYKTRKIISEQPLWISDFSEKYWWQDMFEEIYFEPLDDDPNISSLTNC